HREQQRHHPDDAVADQMNPALRRKEMTASERTQEVRHALMPVAPISPAVTSAAVTCVPDPTVLAAVGPPPNVACPALPVSRPATPSNASLAMPVSHPPVIATEVATACSRHPTWRSSGSAR